MINALISYPPHVVANLAFTALNNIDQAWANAQSLFEGEAEESYDRMELKGWVAKVVDWLRRGKRPEFDMETELRLMEPIKTDEPGMPAFTSAYTQFQFVKKRMADLHNEVGIIAASTRVAGALDVRMNASDFYWLSQMAKGEALLFRPTERTPEVE